jgi:hypothetical protein
MRKNRRMKKFRKGSPALPCSDMATVKALITKNN